MKTLFWILLIAFVGLVGYVVYNFVQHQKTQVHPTTIPFEVGADSVAAYEQRVADLESRAAQLSKRMAAVGSLDRPEVKARLDEFERQVRDLKQAIALWRVARGGDAPDATYRQCILLYGKASGVCDAMAPDTLK